MKPNSLTDNQTRWLRDLAAGRDPYARLSGQSEHGGATQVIASLHRRGLLERGELTDAGRAAAAAAESEAERLAAVPRGYRQLIRNLRTRAHEKLLIRRADRRADPHAADGDGRGCRPK